MGARKSMTIIWETKQWAQLLHNFRRYSDPFIFFQVLSCYIPLSQILPFTEPSPLCLNIFTFMFHAVRFLINPLFSAWHNFVMGSFLLNCNHSKGTVYWVFEGWLSLWHELPSRYMNCHLYFYSKMYIALWNCLFHLVEVFLTPKFMFCFIIFSSPVISVFWSMSDRNMVNNMMLLELDNFELWIWKIESTFLLYKEAPQFRSTKIEYSVRIISNSCQSWFPHGKKKALCGSHGKESIHNAGDRVWSLGQQDSLEKEMATHSSILAWEIPWREEPGSL